MANTERQTTNHTHNYRHFRATSSPKLHVFGPWEEAREPVEPPRRHREYMQTTCGKTQIGTEPATFMLWGDSVSTCTSVPPSFSVLDISHFYVPGFKEHHWTSLKLVCSCIPYNLGNHLTLSAVRSVSITTKTEWCNDIIFTQWKTKMMKAVNTEPAHLKQLAGCGNAVALAISSNHHCASAVAQNSS